jgi:hypothetical protein
MSERIKQISKELMSLGAAISDSKQASKHERRVGNLLELIGGVITSERDTEEFDKFSMYFSGKKIVETITPETLLLIKRLGESPGMTEFITDMFGASDNCDECPIKDICDDRHCANSEDSTDEEKPKDESSPKKRKPRKPKND